MKQRIEKFATEIFINTSGNPWGCPICGNTGPTGPGKWNGFTFPQWGATKGVEGYELEIKSCGEPECNRTYILGEIFEDMTNKLNRVIDLLT